MWQVAIKTITSTFAATIMKIGYGIAVQESNDPYISIAEKALTSVAEAGIPGAFWVDFLPILKYVPSRLHVWEKSSTQWPKNLSVMCKNNWYRFIFLRAHELL